MASVTYACVNYGKTIMSSVIMAKILWQMKLSRANILARYVMLVSCMTCNVYTVLYT